VPTYIEYLYDGVLGLGMNQNEDLQQYSYLQALIKAQVI